MVKGGGKLEKAGRGTGKAHGKDAALADLVTAAEGEQSKGGFDAKKIGKKQVFRPILMSPFHAGWPSLSSIHADVILHTLLQVLQSEGVKQHWKRENSAVPRSSAQKTKEKNRRRRARLALAVLKRHGIVPSLSVRKPSPTESGRAEEASVQTKPFLCGLNSVTRQMESLIRSQVAQSVDQPTSTAQHSPSIVFVCQFDVDPPSLVSHLPLLTSTYNAVSEGGAVLIRLPKGAEQQICQAIGLRRCSVLSIDDSLLDTNSEAKKSVDRLMDKIREAGLEAMRLDWLEKAVNSIEGKDSHLHLMEPEVKHMKSSAPLDMNALKAAKRTERAERKTARRKRKVSKAMVQEEQRQQTKKRRKLKS